MVVQIVYKQCTECSHTNWDIDDNDVGVLLVHYLRH